VSQALSEHLFRRPGQDRHLKSAGVGINAGEHGAQSLQSGQIWCRGYDLQGSPLNEQLGLEHHGLGAFADGYPAAAAEQKSQIGTDQNPTRGRAMNLELIG
jgi:hypothetical protein